MMLNVPLLTQRGLRLFTGRKTFKELCDRQWIVHPSEKAVAPPAIYLDGALEHVTGAQPETTLAYEIQQVFGGPKEHIATTAYQLRDVHLVDGYLYKASMKLPLTTAKESLLRSSQAAAMSQAALACTLTSNRYFGHWITDGLTMNLAAAQLAPAVTTAQIETSHQIDYRRLFNVHATMMTNASFKQLIILEDFGQNSYKRDRYHHMRSQLRQTFPPSASPGVMLLRGTSGVQRVLVNEQEVAKFLHNQGFTILDPQTLSASEIVQQTLGAKVVVGVEGSQLIHGLFTLADRGTILTLQPPYRFNSVFKDYTDCLELNYAFVVGKQVEGGFEIDVNALGKTLDKLSLTLA